MFNFYFCVSTEIVATGVEHSGIAGTGQYFQCHLYCQACCVSYLGCLLGSAGELWAVTTACVSPGYPVTHTLVGFWRNTGSQVHPMMWGFPVDPFLAWAWKAACSWDCARFPGTCGMLFSRCCVYISLQGILSSMPSFWHACPEAALGGVVSSWRGGERVDLVFVYWLQQNFYGILLLPAVAFWVRPSEYKLNVCLLPLHIDKKMGFIETFCLWLLGYKQKNKSIKYFIFGRWAMMP